MVNHSLGGIILMSGTPPKANETFGARIAAFASADLDGLLSPDEQGDLADALKLLVHFRNRLEHDQWDAQLAQSANTGVVDAVVGFGETGHIDTSLATIEILASVFESVGDAAQDLDVMLMQRHLIDKVVPGSTRDQVRVVLREVARVTTNFAPQWRWIDHNRRA